MIRHLVALKPRIWRMPRTFGKNQTRVLGIIILNRPRRLARTTMERLRSDRRPSYRRWSNVDKSGTSPMRDNDTRYNDGRGAVRLENDRICMFERDGIYQARIR